MKKIPTRNLYTSILFASLVLTLSTSSISAGNAPVFTNALRLPEGQMQVQIVVEPGESYTLELSTNLQTWLPVVNFRNVETNLLTLVDPEPVQLSAMRFYRMKLGAETLYEFTFQHYANGGQFNAGLTPSVSFPVNIQNYSANFYAWGGMDYPSPTNVFFTGPAGSGLAGSQADATNSWINNEEAVYQSAFISTPSTAPGGTWIVSYNGEIHQIEKPDPQANARLVIPVPTVSLSGNQVQSVSWTYRSAATSAQLAEPPPFMTSIEVQFEDEFLGRVYNSPELAPSNTSHILESSVAWDHLMFIALAYDDDLGNHYVIFFNKP